MKKTKKYLLSLCTFGTIITPISITVSCAGNNVDGGNLDLKIKKYDLFDFNKFGTKIMKDEPIMYRGISYTAQMHGMSFIYNIAHKLGWDWDDNTTLSEETKSKAKFGLNAFKILQANLDKKEITEDKKHLLGNTRFDPLGADGATLPTNQYDGMAYEFMQAIGADLNDFSKATYNKWGLYTIMDSENIKHTLRINTFSSFIDGDNPGNLILKAYVNMKDGSTLKSKDIKNIEEVQNIKDIKGSNFIINKIRSPKNIYQTFYKIENPNKRLEMIQLLWEQMNNFKKLVKNGSKTHKDMLKRLLPPIVASFMDWLKNSKLVMKDFINAFDSLNNGSHYMLAVEIFARGIKNLPEIFQPNGVFAKVENEKIFGLANTDSLLWGLGTFFYGPSKGKGEWNGKKSTEENIPFNPAKIEIINNIKNMSYNQIKEKQDGKIKTGKEMPTFGGKIKMWKDKI